MSGRSEAVTRRRRLRREAGRRAVDIWRANRWYILSAVALLAMALGIWGITEHHHATTGTGLPFTTRLYKSLKLFSLGADELSGPIPWQLEVARFLAPLVVFTTIVGAVVAALQRGSARARARRMRGHTIVVGLGDKGLTLAEQIDAAGDPVVVIERDEHAANMARARLTGIPVLVADASEPRALLAAGFDRADHLVSMAGTPDVNASVAAAVLDVQRAIDPDATGTLRSFIEIGDIDVVRELQTAVDPVRARYRQEFFSLEDRAAQALAGRFDEIWDAPNQPAPPRPMVVVGLGQLGDGFIVELARRWDVVRLEVGARHASVPLSIVAVSCDEHDTTAAAVERLRVRYPKIRAHDWTGAGPVPACTIDVVRLDLCNPRAALDAAINATTVPPLAVVLTIDDESLQVRAALAARTVIGGRDTRLVVTARHREGLAGLVGSASDARPALELFPIMESVCRDDEITEGRLAAMARSIHESYRRHVVEAPSAAEYDGRALVEWAELDTDLRAQNIEAAQSTWDGLSQLGLRVIPLRSDDADQFCFSDEQLEYLAAREHRRWFAAKYPGQSPPSWEDVEESDRRKTRRQIQEIPRMLAFAGLEVERDGHDAVRTMTWFDDHHVRRLHDNS